MENPLVPSQIEINKINKTQLGPNHLKPIALKCYPELKQTELMIKNISNLDVYMSGSGSTFFICLSNWEKALDLEKKLINKLPKDHFIKAVKPVTYGSTLKEIS